ncbi:hypothetical protein MBLNU230_g4951t1 [Neophaeotheca triangularis]
MSSNNPKARQDNWSTEAYNASAAFVPQLTTKVLQLLAPQPTDHILDIGSGDGQLTARIANHLLSGHIHGLDNSPAFIHTAQTTHTPNSKTCTYELQDCTTLSTNPTLMATQGQWDKLFSNAALHWILRNPATRHQTLQTFHSLLRPQGRLVFEMGGAGNVAETHSALIAGLVAHGVPLARAREASPWFFPSEPWMRKVLGELGFEIEVAETEYRPTKLMHRGEDGEGGLEGWVRLMGAEFLAVLEGEELRERVVGWVCGVLESVVRREEDGSMWLGYVRLRVVARKV